MEVVKRTLLKRNSIEGTFVCFLFSMKAICRLTKFSYTF